MGKAYLPICAMHSACVSLFFQLSPGRRGGVFILWFPGCAEIILILLELWYGSGLCKLIHARNGAYGPINRVSGLPRAFSFRRRQTHRTWYIFPPAPAEEKKWYFISCANRMTLKKFRTTHSKLAGIYIYIIITSFQLCWIRSTYV